MPGVTQVIGSAHFEPSVAERLFGLPDIVSGFVPAPPATDRVFWTGLSDGMKKALIADAEQELETPWPALTASAYRAFTQTGDRAGYEAGYFARRLRLNSLALAEAVEGAGRFVDALIDGIVLVCEESGWQLPAHNSQERDGVCDPLPDPDRPVIDLFAAETGAQLSLIAFLLRTVLDAKSPMIVSRIKREVSRRITRPYLDRHFWWMGHGDEKMNNWTAWCTQNVLLSTFTRPTGQATRRAVIAKAAVSLDAFLKDYGEDGACDEGALYYRHAALCLFGALTVMDAVAPGVFSSLWHAPKIRNMAEFIVNVHVAGASYINFADASAVLDPCGAREFLFGKRVGSEALCALAAADARGRDPKAPPVDRVDDISLLHRLMEITATEEMAAFEKRPQTPPDIYYPSAGLFVARDGRLTVAAKAGDNDDGHNHNDVGSVTIYAGKEPILIDVGVETYTKKTFSPERYAIWTMQSAWHNLPSFEGIMQKAGADYAARDVTVDLGEEISTIEMDIAGAYPQEAGVSRYWRRVRLVKGRHVEITDRHEGSRPAELSLMLSKKPVVSANRIILDADAAITVSGGGAIRVEDIPISDPRLRLAWPGRLYRVLVPLAERELRLVVTADGVSP